MARHNVDIQFDHKGQIRILAADKYDSTQSVVQETNKFVDSFAPIHSLIHKTKSRKTFAEHNS